MVSVVVGCVVVETFESRPEFVSVGAVVEFGEVVVPFVCFLLVNCLCDGLVECVNLGVCWISGPEGVSGVDVFDGVWC